MDNISKDEDKKNSAFYAQTASILSRSIDFLFMSILLSILINIISNTFTNVVPPSVVYFCASVMHLIVKNMLFSFLLLIILLLIRYISYLGSRIPVIPSYKMSERDYLSHIKVLTQTLVPTDNLKEINHLNLSSRLDDSFVLPEFFLNQPLVSQPIEEEILRKAHLQDEVSWRSPNENNQRIQLTSLWAGLTRDCPAAVIQGYPGMGKSTLLAGLALYMAHCRSARWKTYVQRLVLLGNGQFLFSKLAPLLPDKHSRLISLLPITPPLIPIIINLRKYALSEYNRTSIFAYLKAVFGELGIPTKFLNDCLARGECLVLFDGLDEVSKDEELYSHVQGAIKDFISRCRRMTERTQGFNRFLITSRVVDYNYNSFPDADFLHTIIAEITPAQRKDHLKGHSFSAVRYRYHPHFRLKPFEDVRAIIEKEATEGAEYLDNAITVTKDRNIEELAKNPLMLRLFVEILVNQGEGKFQLPKKKAELYKVITTIFLQDYNDRRADQKISSEQALQHLGLLAITLQAKDSGLIHHDEVMLLLKQSMNTTVEQEAKNFLRSFCERSGLFVQCSDNYFAFSHRTFQEYFAALYLLRDIRDKDKQANAIRELIDKASHHYWHEPFLIAVAYLSGGRIEDKKLASKIVSDLIDIVRHPACKHKEQTILLITNCLSEVESHDIHDDLKKIIIEQLIYIYEDTLKNREFKDGQTTEDAEKTALNDDNLQKIAQSLPDAIMSVYDRQMIKTLLNKLCSSFIQENHKKACLETLITNTTNQQLREIYEQTLKKISS